MPTKSKKSSARKKAPPKGKKKPATPATSSAPDNKLSGVDSATQPDQGTLAIIPSHQWTHKGDEVFILKCVDPEGKAYGGFSWPLTVGATVEAPDWDPTPKCGGGLHGWAWGIGIGGGKDPDWHYGIWIAFSTKPEDVVHIVNDGSGDKDKARCCVIRYVSKCGDWQGATNFILAGQIAWVQQASRGAASATGSSGAASATGYRGAASATGSRGAASATGSSGAASATGSRGAASATGSRGAASATGYRGAASATGDRGAAVAGLYGRARAGKFGCVGIAFWNATDGRQEMRCREVGAGDGSDGKLKSCVWYRLDEAGEFMEDANQQPAMEAES